MQTPEILKVSVLSSGDILLDGQSTSLEDLGQAFQRAKERNAAVWYYREAPAADPAHQAAQVIQMIVQNKLPVRLCTKPDFSESLDAQAPLETAFESVRKRAAAAREVLILQTNGKIRAMAAPPAGSVPPQAVKSVEGLISPAVPRNVAIIASTAFASSDVAGIAEAGQAIPFFGLLIGLCYIGHAVWIFEGRPALLAAGCRDADALIVDSAMLPQLPKDWEKIAQQVMRNPNILVHDRKSFKLMAKGRVEFLK